MARTILTDDQYTAALKAAGSVLGQGGVSSHWIDATVSATLAAVGLLSPPPTPDPDTCTAMFADPDGEWWQCSDDPDHDGDSHDGGDWGWSDSDPDTIPRRTD
ncbi:hypothetical protein [Streptomyces sp. NPDC054975]